MKILWDLLSGLIDKVGFKAAGSICIVVGIVWVLPYFGIPGYVVQGIGWIGVGIAILAFGKKAKDDNVSEAEKRLANPNLPSTSAVPAIQEEIVKLQNPTPK